MLTSLATGAGARLVTVLAWRYLLGAALLAFVSGLAPLLRARRSALPLLVLAGLGQAAIAFVSLSALRYIPAATLSFLFYTYPAWVAIIAAVRGRERLTPIRALALVLSLAGIVVMVGAPWSQSLHPAGVVLALASALIYAAYIPFIDHFRGELPAAVASTYITLGAGILLGVVGLATNSPMVALHRTAWMAILALGLFSTAIAFVAFLRGLRTLGTVRAAIVSTVEPFWTAILGAWLLTQELTAGTIVGGTLIATAVVVLQWRGNRD